MGRSRRPQPAKLASKLREIRVKLNLSQQQMAEHLSRKKISVRPGHISDYELGKREPPLAALLAYSRLAGVYLDVLVDDLIGLPERLPAGSKHKMGVAKQS